MADLSNNPHASDLTRGSLGNQPDIVDISSADSFPASDAPPWTLGRAERERRVDPIDMAQQIADSASGSAVLAYEGTAKRMYPEHSH